MPKRIVLCFDGTWNRPGDADLDDSQQTETNVRRFYESVAERAPDGTVQVAWYDQGVGTHWYDRVIGGIVGSGLDINIVQGYRFLAEQYEDGDDIFVLGFSRGAYTARSLGGMIRNCGLVKCRFVDLQSAIAYGIYRTRDDGVDSTAAKLFRRQFAREVRIKFIGVWDTVGALGIPLQLFKDVNANFYQFHDNQLSNIVDHAFHALAIDEHRRDYDACLWTPTADSRQQLEQRWFVGAHSDVGGGYADRRLSDLPLRWMQEEAHALGLQFVPGRRVETTSANCRGLCTDSYARFLKGVYAKAHPRYYRAISQTRFGNETVDESVKQRLRDDATYQPQNRGLERTRD
jgi:uncharacterized protein (DUF2235 family)